MISNNGLHQPARQDVDQSIYAIPVLTPMFTGELAPYRNVLVLAGDPRAAITGSDLLRPQTLETLLQHFRPDHNSEVDRRGLASEWSKCYFIRLIPPVLAAAMLLHWRLPLRLEDLAVVVDESGMPQAFKLPHGGTAFSSLSSDPFERFAHLLDDNLSPLIQALSRHTKVSPRVFWSNAGNYCEGVISRLKAMSVPSDSLADGRALLSLGRRPDGARNPLYQPVRYVEAIDANGQRQQWRQRRCCCLRYLLPELNLCGNCPRLSAPPPE